MWRRRAGTDRLAAAGTAAQEAILPTKRVSITVPPNAVKHLGLRMTMGRLTAVQAHSPAAAAGIEPGGRVVRPDGDPMTLPGRLDRLAGQQVELAIQHQHREQPVTTALRLREPIEISPCESKISPVAASALGVAYRVLPEVESVAAGSPADRAALRPGDVILTAKLTLPAEELSAFQRLLKRVGFEAGVASIDFHQYPYAWPAVVAAFRGRNAPGHHS